MKLIRTEDAAGHVLCHDLTQIIKGEFKGPRFRKGHIVTQADIPVLLSMGKENLYVWEMVPGMVHENDAAERLCRLCANRHMNRSEVKEGKIELTAACDGLFRVDVERLNAINTLDDIMIATRHANTAVRAGDKLCGTRVIPLVIEEEKLRAAEEIGSGRPLLELLHSRFPDQEFICFTEAENQASMGLLRKLGYQDLGFIPKIQSEAFGKWLTPASEAELRQATLSR